MSQGQMLRALVNERLAAAAEDIFVLFERTIAEYEEELFRTKKDNKGNRQPLDKILSPRIEEVKGNFQILSNPGPSLSQEITKTQQIKEEPEEHGVKQEEEQLPVPVPESSAVCLTTKESSLLQQRQTEHREESQGEDISSEPHFLLETERHTEHSSDTDNDDDWGTFSCSAAQMETEVDGDHYTQIESTESSTNLSLQNKSAPETTVHSEHISGGTERMKYQCSFCNKIFRSKCNLEKHIRVHTGEKPFSCLICDKTFGQKVNLNRHKRTHTSERPYSCPTCYRKFAQKGTLDAHQRTHTGERPYSCTSCPKTFSQKINLDIHQRTHTGEKPYSCSNCNKRFAHSSALRQHTRTHTGERPYSCPFCEKTFSTNSNLHKHKKTHMGENPFSC